MNIPVLSLFEGLKLSDHKLTMEKVLHNPIDEDLMFKELDKVGVACVLGPLITCPPPPPREFNDLPLILLLMTR